MGIDYTIIISSIVGVISSTVTGFVTFFQTKKKYYAEVDSNLIQNLHEALEFYKNISDDNKKRLEELSEKNKQLEKEVGELRDKVFTLMENVCYKYSCTVREKELSTSPKRDHSDSNKEKE